MAAAAGAGGSPAGTRGVVFRPDVGDRLLLSNTDLSYWLTSDDKIRIGRSISDTTDGPVAKAMAHTIELTGEDLPDEAMHVLGYYTLGERKPGAGALLVVDNRLGFYRLPSSRRASKDFKVVKKAQEATAKVTACTPDDDDLTRRLDAGERVVADAVRLRWMVGDEEEGTLTLCCTPEMTAPRVERRRQRRGGALEFARALAAAAVAEIAGRADGQDAAAGAADHDSGLDDVGGGRSEPAGDGGGDAAIAGVVEGEDSSSEFDNDESDEDGSCDSDDDGGSAVDYMPTWAHPTASSGSVPGAGEWSVLRT